MHVETIGIEQIDAVRNLAAEMELSEIEEKIEQMQQYDHSTFMGKPNAIGLNAGMMISHADKVSDEKLDEWYQKIADCLTIGWMKFIKEYLSTNL